MDDGNHLAIVTTAKIVITNTHDRNIVDAVMMTVMNAMVTDTTKMEATEDDVMKAVAINIVIQPHLLPSKVALLSFQGKLIWNSKYTLHLEKNVLLTDSFFL
jgi:hypothetical protein